VNEALQQALEKRKVPYLDLTAFFVNDSENSMYKNQKIILSELEDYGSLYDSDKN
jgi:hypothetical protein